MDSFVTDVGEERTIRFGNINCTCKLPVDIYQKFNSRGFLMGLLYELE